MKIQKSFRRAGIPPRAIKQKRRRPQATISCSARQYHSRLQREVRHMSPSQRAHSWKVPALSVWKNMRKQRRR